MFFPCNVFIILCHFVHTPKPAGLTQIENDNLISNNFRKLLILNYGMLSQSLNVFFVRDKIFNGTEKVIFMFNRTSIH